MQNSSLCYILCAMNITLTTDQILLCFVSMVATLSPLGIISPFSALTSDYSRDIQKKIAFRVSLYCTLCMIILAWVGELLLKILGISLPTLTATGGLILLLNSLPLALKGSSSRKKVDPDAIDIDESDWNDLVVTPLIFPLTLGAGVISLVITYAGQMQTIGDRLIFNGVILSQGLIILLIYYFAGPLSRKIGPQGNMVMNRIAGIILLSLAFNLLTTGLKGLLPGLAG